MEMTPAELQQLADFLAPRIVDEMARRGRSGSARDRQRRAGADRNPGRQKRSSMSETRETETPATTSDEWAIVEIFGHRRLAGRIREVQRYGATFLEITAVDGDRPQLYGGGSLFSVTSCTEAEARQLYAPTSIAIGYLPAPEDVDDDDEDTPF